MIVTPLPWRGGVQADLRNDGRALRVAPHPQQELVSLSMWRGDACIATHQMSATDVSELMGVLAHALAVVLQGGTHAEEHAS
jgi:hypothetical protein